MYMQHYMKHQVWKLWAWFQDTVWALAMEGIALLIMLLDLQLIFYMQTRLDVCVKR